MAMLWIFAKSFVLDVLEQQKDNKGSGYFSATKTRFIGIKTMEC
jgi:hypothetical protein